MLVPANNALQTNRLAQVFRNTTATYKFYWFIAIVELFVIEKKSRMSFWEIIVRMIANAWYPVHYFKLSFGSQDSLFNAILQLQSLTNIPIDADKPLICNTLLQRLHEPAIAKQLRVFAINVPYRFLSPWIPYSTDNDVIVKSQRFTNDCPYRIEVEPEGKYVKINPSWEEYLVENCQILLDYSYWNLALFLQPRNPNAPDLVSKLVRPLERAPLTRQRDFWNSVIEIAGPMPCIYTQRPLSQNDFDLDHFIPWSFVSHDLMWNLLPADASVNASKSNHIPDIERFLPDFAQRQQFAIRTIYERTPNNKLLEDYLELGPSISELTQLSPTAFYKLYRKTISPIAQIAENMGFAKWKPA